MMMKPTVEVRDDGVYSIEPIMSFGDEVSLSGGYYAQEHLVLTKEAFCECYEKWILNKEVGDGELC